MNFFGLQIAKQLNWTNHIDKLNPKLPGACYAVRYLFHISNTDTGIFYFAYFHSTVSME
jgi:hypothetical protein